MKIFVSDAKLLACWCGIFLNDKLQVKLGNDN